MATGLISAASSTFDAVSTWFSLQFPGLASHFMVPAALLTLLVLIPFLLLYFIRPKPRKERIPSLMFLMSDRDRMKFNSFLRRFVQDLLFYLQLLAILFLGFAAAKPYFNVPETTLAGNVVLILDGSASMQANDRFQTAVQSALDNLGRQNTIIMAAGRSIVYLDRGTKDEAEGILKSLKPTESRTDLVSPLTDAQQYIRNEGIVFVFSDFSDTEHGAAFEKSAKYLETQGITVIFKPIGSPVRNVGIVDLSVKEDKTILVAKNYMDIPATARLKVNGELVDTKTLPQKSTDLFTFTTPSGLAKASIDVEDEFPLDNEVTISTPEESTARVLIITNDGNIDRSLLKYATLESISQTTSTHLDIQVATPPQIPAIDHDLIIVKDVDPKLLLPGHIAGVRERVKQGAALIIMAQRETFSMDFGDLLPYTFLEEHDRVGVKGLASSLTEDVEFGTAAPYFKVAAAEGVTPVAVASDADESPIIGYLRYADGFAAYYGIVDATSDFKLDPRYAIFWKNLINLLMRRQSLSNLNLRTGDALRLSRVQPIKMPNGQTVESSSLILDRQGPYVTEDRVVAANLLSLDESDLTAQNPELAKAVAGHTEPSDKPLIVTPALVVLAGLMLFGELILLKLRGDA